MCLLGLAACAPAVKTPGAGAGGAAEEGARVETAPLDDTAYVFPIARGTLPTNPDLMPNAERGYRGGVHQGMDLYGLESGDTLPCGTPVRNARAGWVVRADREWKQMFPKEYDRLTAVLKDGPNEELLDRLRGRQVWIRAADGMTFRYCHLAETAVDVQVGVAVAAGVPLGKVGNTGTIDGARGTGRNCHLHFEIWPTEAAWLGKGLAPRAACALYGKLFGLEGR